VIAVLVSSLTGAVMVGAGLFVLGYQFLDWCFRRHPDRMARIHAWMHRKLG